VTEAVDHVRVPQPFDRVELALESGHRIDRPHELEVQDLHRNRKVIRLAIRAPDLTKSTLADHAIESEASDLRRLRGLQQSMITTYLMWTVTRLS